MALADQTEQLDALDAIYLEADFATFRIVRISDGVEDVLGYSPAQCMEPGFLLDELIHPDDKERVISSITHAHEVGRSETNFRACHRNGELISLYVLIGSDFEADEPRLRALLVRSESKVESSAVSEQRLQLALESAEMGVWDWNVLDASIYWSEQLYQLHGCTPEEIGDVLENYGILVSRIHPEDFESVHAIVINSLRTGEDYDIEYRFRMPDESYRWLYVKGRMYVDGEGNPIRVAGTAQDVTARKTAEIAARRELEERKRAEAALTKLTETLEQRVRSRTDDLESANAKLKDEVNERTRAELELARANRRLVHSNRELQDFAYVASHDLKEPLRKIATFADLLRADCEKDISDDGLFYIERMQESASRMLTLINDLLDFSRVKTSGVPFAAVDLNDVLRHVLSDLEVRIRDSGASISIDDLPTILADRTQMRQLFQNLISNALKFQSDSKPPVISVRNEPADDDAEYSCRIVVEDNGIGFEAKYADRVFSPFQRLHTSYEGTGIGLAICRRIVERHQGVISVTSKPGEGTAFTIQLSVEQPRIGDSGDVD